MRFFIKFLCFLITSDACAMSSVQAIQNFQTEKYLGKWYEIARLPMFAERNCHTPITANYQLNPSNNNQILVENSCYKADGTIRRATGLATFAKTSDVAELKVNFLPRFLSWVPFTKADYWVLYTDYDHVALVGLPNHKYLWILSRKPELEQADINKLIDIAKQQGFETEKLIFNKYNLSA